MNKIKKKIYLIREFNYYRSSNWGSLKDNRTSFYTSGLYIYISLIVHSFSFKLIKEPSKRDLEDLCTLLNNIRKLSKPTARRNCKRIEMMIRNMFDAYEHE